MGGIILRFCKEGRAYGDPEHPLVITNVDDTYSSAGDMKDRGVIGSQSLACHK